MSGTCPDCGHGLCACFPDVPKGFKTVTEEARSWQRRALGAEQEVDALRARVDELERLLASSHPDPVTAAERDRLRAALARIPSLTKHRDNATYGNPPCTPDTCGKCLAIAALGISGPGTEGGGT